MKEYTNTNCHEGFMGHYSVNVVLSVFKRLPNAAHSVAVSDAVHSISDVLSTFVVHRCQNVC